VLRNNNKGNVIKLAINNVGCYGLIDTGASVCVLSERMYKKCRLHACNKSMLQSSKITSVIGVGEKVTKVLGEVVVPLTISGLTLFQTFLVIPGNSAPEIILGENFLYEQRANIDFSQGTLSLQKGMVTVTLEPPQSKQNKICFVKTMTYITVSAQSECLLPVKISKTSKDTQNNDNFGLIQPTLSLPNKWNVAGPRCAVKPSNNNCVYRLLNPFPRDIHIPKGTIVGTFTLTPDAHTSLVHIGDIPNELNVLDSEIQPEQSISTLNPQAPDFIPAQTTQAHVHCISSDNLSNNQNTDNTDNSDDYITRLLSYTQQNTMANVNHVATVNSTTSSQQTTNSQADNISTAKQLNVKISDTLTKTQSNKLLETIGKNRDVFATCVEELGCYKDYQHVINTGDSPAVKHQFYRTSPDKKQEIERQVKILMKNGIVERSTSDWLSPVILVKKADNSWRLVIDYRGLNKLVKPVYFPLTRHEDVIDALGQKLNFILLPKLVFWIYLPNYT
jgi:hypothetical protein